MELSQAILDQLIPFFPLDTPRDSQLRAMRFVAKAFVLGYRDIVLSAPTGTGKSALNVAVCQWAKSDHARLLDGEPGGYYLTVQKILQTQLETDFRTGKFKRGIGSSLKSAVEYECPVFKNCAAGGHASKSKKRCTCACPYQVAKEQFVASTTAITNYPYLFSEHRYVGKLPKRRVIIFDEAHHLAKQIERFNDVAVGDALIKQWTGRVRHVDISGIKSLDDFVSWLENVYGPAAQELLELMKDVIESESLTPEQAKDVVELDQHVRKTSRAVKMINEDPSNWVFWVETDRDGDRTCIARPLDASAFAKEYLHEMGSLRIYSSAFVGQKDQFCKSLGLDPNKVAWQSLPSPFKASSRPIFIAPVGSMSKKNADQTFPNFVKAAIKILDTHANQKGLIHCNSYALGQKIFDALKDGKHGIRLLFPKNSDERESMFNQHRTSDVATVIITPSMTEGFDFADDLARWQIIAKVPYPSLGDMHTVAKKDIDERWYALEVIKTLVQACGRICRSDDDYGVTYITDSDFEMVYRRHEKSFPAWWTEAVKWIRPR